MMLFSRRRSSVWRVDQVRRQRRLQIQATQLGDRGVVKRSEQRRILDEWVGFLSTTPTRALEIDFVSRVPQALLDAVAAQRQLRSLHVKWGPYSDPEAISSLSGLEYLDLGGARAVEDVAPLGAMQGLTTLVVDGAFRVRDPAAIGDLVGLDELTFGNCYPGTDRLVDVADLDWLKPLVNLTTLSLPGTRIAPDALAALLELPELTTLRLPLRRSYRTLVFSYAEESPAFAGVARDYADFEESRVSFR